jgi:hypothetical protein
LGAGESMSDNSVSMKVKHGINPPVVTANISITDAGDVIRGLGGEPDVTVTISKSDPADGEIMLAISNGMYFLGLFSAQGDVYQYIAAGNERLRGRAAFSIEGALTGIESRYVVDAGAAVAAIQEWVTVAREAATSGNWMKM